MSDLTGQLIQVNGVVIAQQLYYAFQKLQAFVLEKKNQTITIKQNGGYMSKYRLVEELALIAKPNTTWPQEIRDLITKATTPGEFDAIAKDTKQFEALENYLNKKAESSTAATSFTAPSPAFQSFTSTPDHPYIVAGQQLYGVPNKTQNDPRRSGKFILIDYKSDEIYEFMRLNAPDYGFVWYGIDKSYWIYEEQKSTLDSVKAAVNNTTNVNYLTDLFT